MVILNPNKGEINGVIKEKQQCKDRPLPRDLEHTLRHV